jgi:outer membrane protein
MFRQFFCYVTLIVLLSASIILTTGNPGAAAAVGAVENPAPAAAAQPLTLKKCLKMAYANNHELKAATQSVVVAQANVKKAEGDLLPSLGYEFSATKANETMSSYNTDELYSGNLTASYPLYTGGKLQNTSKIAKLQLDLAKEKERSAKQNLTYNVKETYHKVWLAEEQLLVANASYENMARHAERIAKLYHVGNTSKFELLRAQVNRDNQKPAVIKAQNGVAVAKLALATLIGLPKESRVAIAFEADQVKLPELPKNKLEPVLATAYANRFELKQSKLTASISEVQVALAESYLKPNVSLSGGYQGSGYELGPDSWNKYWTLTLDVQGNFFKGSNKPKVAAAKAELELNKIQENSLKDSIRQEVDQVLHSIKENYETAKSTQASIGLAKESLRLTEVRFQAGMATTMDVMDAQLALDQALTGYYSSLAAYLTAMAKLDLVTGAN